MPPRHRRGRRGALESILHRDQIAESDIRRDERRSRSHIYSRLNPNRDHRSPSRSSFGGQSSRESSRESSLGPGQTSRTGNSSQPAHEIVPHPVQAFVNTEVVIRRELLHRLQRERSMKQLREQQQKEQRERDRRLKEAQDQTWLKEHPAFVTEFRSAQRAYHAMESQVKYFYQHFAGTRKPIPTMYFEAFDSADRYQTAAQTYKGQLGKALLTPLFRPRDENAVTNGLNRVAVAQADLQTRFRQHKPYFGPMFAELDNEFLDVARASSNLRGLARRGDIDRESIQQCYTTINDKPWIFQHWAYHRSVVTGTGHARSVKDVFTDFYGADQMTAILAVARLVNISYDTGDQAYSEIVTFINQVISLSDDVQYWAYHDDTYIKRLFRWVGVPWTWEESSGSSNEGAMEE